jgi:cellulose biosynthesis protein BcsQ
MKTVCFFNNKGGVGKTTLTCNIAANFARTLGSRVLVIDGDPQCNATQLIIGDQKTSEYYWPERVTEAGFSTLLDIVNPIQEGDSEINPQINPLLGSQNRFGVDLIAGHPRLSIVEDTLSQAWNSVIGGDIGGLRKSNWCSALFNLLGNRYDVAFIDLGPSLGSINRSVLLGSDYFVTPLGSDVFSIVGVRNIAEWLKQWSGFYSRGLETSEKLSPGSLAKYPSIKSVVPIITGYVGYTLQQYITKSKGGVRRPTLAFDRILNQVPTEIEQSLGTFLAEGITMREAKLGDVPNMFSLIPLAQSVNAPIAALESSDGLVGSQFMQKADYTDILNRLSRSLARNIGVGHAQPNIR